VEESYKMIINNGVNEALKHVFTKKGLTKVKELHDLIDVDAEGNKLIDYATISLHLSGNRQVNLQQAKAYSKALGVSWFRIIDESIIKYPIVANYKYGSGEVYPRDKDQFEFLVCNNQINYIAGTQVILADKKDVAVIYNENYINDITKLTQNNMQPIYVFIEDGKEFIFSFHSIDEKTKTITGYNTVQKKEIVWKYDKFYPINEIIWLSTIPQSVNVIEANWHEPENVIVPE